MNFNNSQLIATAHKQIQQSNFIFQNELQINLKIQIARIRPTTKNNKNMLH